MTRRINRIPSLLAALAAMSCLGACASSVEGPREFTVAPGAYGEAFDATRETLRELDFDLDRVDAASGVITTRPHFSPGLLEPWDRTQTGLGQEWEDTLNMQAREVRVTFAPREPAASSEAEPGPAVDLRQAESELVGTVWVTISRQHRAGRRLDAEWVGGSTFFIDPELGARAGQRYRVPIKRDERLESRLAAEISERIGAEGSAEPPESSESGDQQSE